MLTDGVDVDRAVERGRPGSRIDMPTALWMATAGGADLLGIDAGLLAPGRVFDAIAVDLTAIDTAIGTAAAPDLPDGDDVAGWAQILERIVRNGQRSIIDRVWVNGRQVSGHQVSR
jgi:cytosine/adenosine deaminase-related metal-dependent hydrolase